MSGYITEIHCCVSYIIEIHLCVEVKAFHQLVNLPLEAVNCCGMNVSRNVGIVLNPTFYVPTEFNNFRELIESFLVALVNFANRFNGVLYLKAFHQLVNLALSLSVAVCIPRWVLIRLMVHQIDTPSRGLARQRTRPILQTFYSTAHGLTYDYE